MKAPFKYPLAQPFLVPLSVDAIGTGQAAALPLIPVVKASSITTQKNNGILVRWDRPMSATCDIADHINVVIDGAAPVHPQQVIFDPVDPMKMGIILPTPFIEGQTVTWAYDDQGPCDLQEISAPNTEADNQTYSVSNLLQLAPFLAAYFDSSDYKAQQMVFGDAPATSIHTSTIYAHDHDGLFTPFGADKPVFSGGRVVGNDAYADDGTGTLLTPVPMLVSQGECMNMCKISYDLTHWVGTATAALDSVGINGLQDHASTVIDSSGTVIHSCQLYPKHIQLTGTSRIVFQVFLRKDNSVTFNTGIHAGFFSGGVTEKVELSINLASGKYLLPVNAVNASVVVDSIGDFFCITFLIEQQDADNISILIFIQPANYNIDSNVANPALMGSCVVGYVGVYPNRIIEQVRNIGPIFTTGTSVATDAVRPTFQPSNFSNHKMAISMVVRPDGAGLLMGNFLGYGLGPELIADPHFNDPTKWLPGGTANVSNGVMTILSDGTWGNYFRTPKILSKNEAFLLQYNILHADAGLRAILSSNAPTDPATDLTLIPGFNSISSVASDTTNKNFNNQVRVESTGLTVIFDYYSVHKLSAADYPQFSLVDTAGNMLSLPGNVGVNNNVGFSVNSDTGKMKLAVNGAEVEGPYSGKLFDSNKPIILGEGNEYPIGCWHIRNTEGIIAPKPISAFNDGFDSGFK